MANEVIITIATGIFSSIATLGAIWLKAKSDDRIVAQSSTATTMDSINRGFQSLVDHLSAEVDDLRGRVQHLEAELTTLRNRNQQLEGELRLHKQLEESRARASAT